MICCFNLLKVKTLISQLIVKMIDWCVLCSVVIVLKTRTVIFQTKDIQKSLIEQG